MPLVDTLSIENMVATTDLTVELDLTAVAQEVDHASYNPDKSPGLIYRLEDPNTTALVFRSGKLVATGAQSVRAITETIQITADTIRDLGVDIPPDPEATIQNIVMSGDFGQELYLNAIAIGLGLESVEYEPEQFSGLVYRLDDPSVVMLLFGSGKTVITGCEGMDDAEAAIETVYEQLRSLELVD